MGACKVSSNDWAVGETSKWPDGEPAESQHVPHAQRSQASLLNKMGDWTTAGGLPDGSIGNMSGMRNPKDFAQRPWIEGVKSPSKSLVTNQASDT